MTAYLKPVLMLSRSCSTVDSDVWLRYSSYSSTRSCLSSSSVTQEYSSPKLSLVEVYYEISNFRFSISLRYVYLSCRRVLMVDLCLLISCSNDDNLADSSKFYRRNFAISFFSCSLSTWVFWRDLISFDFSVNKILSLSLLLLKSDLIESTSNLCSYPLRISSYSKMASSAGLLYGFFRFVIYSSFILKDIYMS